jgi:hypothetical protein
LIRILAELQEMIALMERQTQPLDSRKEPPRS